MPPCPTTPTRATRRVLFALIAFSVVRCFSFSPASVSSTDFDVSSSLFLPPPATSRHQSSPVHLFPKPSLVPLSRPLHPPDFTHRVLSLAHSQLTSTPRLSALVPLSSAPFPPFTLPPPSAVPSTSAGTRRATAASSSWSSIAGSCSGRLSTSTTTYASFLFFSPSSTDPFLSPTVRHRPPLRHPLLRHLLHPLRTPPPPQARPPPLLERPHQRVGSSPLGSPRRRELQSLRREAGRDAFGRWSVGRVRA